MRRKAHGHGHRLASAPVFRSDSNYQGAACFLMGHIALHGMRGANTVATMTVPLLANWPKVHS
jgi:hypothetical protein